jgi:DNA mismatch repair ATPase MutS
VKRIARIVAAVGVRGNPFAWFALNAVVPWDFIIAERLNHYKRELARCAPAWMEVWFELEALNSLANLAYLNPSYTFPEVWAEREQGGAFVFQAQELGHPLIPDEERVCNDFNVDGLGQVTVITGSNMAGKSVFLKTVGANLALAYAGGPVDARALRTILFRLFTSIQVTDSLTDGISYFYAEVKRLKGLLEELEGEHPVPLFFFVDEIFRGTNNRERLLGSRAYLRTLVEKRGVGLIATHDLELAGLADENPHIRNYHFRDAVTDGRMVFDYRLHPGPCPTTNALRIMAMEGLPVPRETGIDIGHEWHE